MKVLLALVTPLLLMMTAKAPAINATPDITSRQISHLPLQDDATICTLKIAIDNSLYHYWQGNIENVKRNVVEMVEGVNRIYKDHGPLIGKNEEQFWPIKFYASNIMVATDEFCEATGWKASLCFNPEDPIYSEDAFQKLYRFQSVEDLTGHCLGFLLTGILTDDTLGISHSGGACCSRNSTATINPNAGLVAVRQISEASPLRVPYVLAHEIGHSFGAEHDEKPGRLMDAYLRETLTPESATMSNETIVSMHEQLLKISRGEADQSRLCHRRSWCFANASTIANTTVTTTMPTIPEEPTIICIMMYLTTTALMGAAIIIAMNVLYEEILNTNIPFCIDL